MKIDCNQCLGEGKVFMYEDDREWDETCPDCGGTGKVEPVKPTLSSQTNISEIMDYAMTITDKKVADTFFQEMVSWSIENWNVKDMEPSRENAEFMVRKNLGYWAGYYSQDVANRVKKLFGCHKVYE